MTASVGADENYAASQAFAVDAVAAEFEGIPPVSQISRAREYGTLLTFPWAR